MVESCIRYLLLSHKRRSKAQSLGNYGATSFKTYCYGYWIRHYQECDSGIDTLATLSAEQVCWRLQHGANDGNNNPDSRSVLGLAAVLGNIKITKFLTQVEADILEASKFGMTLLKHAAIHDNDDKKSLNLYRIAAAKLNAAGCKAILISAVRSRRYAKAKHILGIGTDRFLEAHTIHCFLEAYDPLDWLNLQRNGLGKCYGCCLFGNTIQDLLLSEIEPVIGELKYGIKIVAFFKRCSASRII